MSNTATLTGLLIPAQGTPTLVEVENHWRTIAAAIGADYIETVYSDVAEEAGLVVVVDEWGRITGRRVNMPATLLLGHPTGPLVGDVLILGDADEEFTSIPQAAADLLLGHTPAGA